MSIREALDAPAVKSREVLGYMDEPIPRYRKDIEGATNRSELEDALMRWPVLASDALAQVRADTFDWDVFESGRNLERKGKFAGEQYARAYGAILMPAAMIQPSLVAAKYSVPWGLAYIRCWQAESEAADAARRNE